MSQVVIKVEDVSKQYRLGLVGTGTLSHDINRMWARMRGKEDPFAKLGDTNDRTTKGSSDFVWSLKDINFEVKHGEVLGIIGRNGAGKSTLLKILSRTTSPTTGKIKIKGRVASLLEVGTGFHPELTGRENIFLNGAILGMSKAEISRKFDEIVDFSGVERYIDTPVKRYSSGMYVRLAFAVAANLEPDILIVDEVLAVGDAEFQKKCLGKMKDVSTKDGRTVLFVSHNMASVENLCKKCIFLEKGTVSLIGNTPEVITAYLSRQDEVDTKLSEVKERKGNGDLFFDDGSIKGVNTDVLNSIESFSEIEIELHYSLKQGVTALNGRIDVGINDYLGNRVAWLSTFNVAQNFNVYNGKITFRILDFPLAPGNYTCNIYSEINNEVADWLTEVLPFTVKEKDYYGTGKLIPANQGSVLLNYSIK